jgi:hypothetical protein
MLKLRSWEEAFLWSAATCRRFRRAAIGFISPASQNKAVPGRRTPKADPVPRAIRSGNSLAAGDQIEDQSIYKVGGFPQFPDFVLVSAFRAKVSSRSIQKPCCFVLF